MDVKDNDTSDVSAEFLHNVQTAVDSTGVGGRVGVINTEQGPLTVIFMDENEGGANTVTSDGDTTIQYVVDNSDASTMQYISDTDGTTIQYVTDDTTTDTSNVQYFQDESGQLIQYVNDTTSLAEEPSSTSGTVQDGATEVITYLVDEAGNIIQYVSGDTNTDTQFVAGDASSDNTQLVTGDVSSEAQYVASSAGTDTTYVASDNATDPQFVASDTSTDAQMVASSVGTGTQLVSDDTNINTRFVASDTSMDTQFVTSAPSTDAQYASVEPSNATAQTNQFADDDNTFTAIPYNPNQAPAVLASDIVHAHTRKTNLDSLVQPLINLQHSTVQSSTKQAGQQIITLTQQSDRGGRSLIYKPQPTFIAPKQPAAISLLKPQPTMAATVNNTTGMTSTRLISSSVSTKPATSLLTNKQPQGLAGHQSSKQTSSLLTMKKPTSLIQSNIVTITPSVSKIMPVAKGSEPVMSFPTTKVTPTQSSMPKIQIITSPSKPKVTTLESMPLVEKTVSHLINASKEQATALNIKNITTGISVTTVPSTYATTVKQIIPSISKANIVERSLSQPSGVEETMKTVSIIVEEPAFATEDPIVGVVEPVADATTTEKPAVDTIDTVEHVLAITTTDESGPTCVDQVTSSTVGSPMTPVEASEAIVQTEHAVAQEAAAGETALVSSTSTNDNQVTRDGDLTKAVEADESSKCSENINEQVQEYKDTTKLNDLPGQKYETIDDDADTLPPEGMEAFSPIAADPFKCKECSVEFPTEKDLRKHIFSSYISNKFFCNICNEDLKSKFRIRRHVLDKHTVGMPYKCPNCPASYNNTSAFWSHAQLHAKLLTCEFCGKAFTHNYDIKRHILSVHSDDKEYICPFCGELLPDQKAYKLHKRVRHGQTTGIIQEAKPRLKGRKPRVKVITGAEESENSDLTTETIEAAKLLVATSNLTAENQSPSEASNKVVLSQQTQHIQLPPGMGDKGEVTIQLFGDGTMMTTDGSNVDYGTIDLSSLGIDPDMLQDNTDIELIIVQGDGDQIKEQLESDPSKLTNVLKDNPTQTVTVKNTAVKVNAGKGKGAKYSKYITAGAGPRPYRCKQCPRTFRYYRHLRCHEIAHTSKTSIVCPLCQRCFVRDANLAAHLELHKNKSMIPEINIEEKKPRKTAKTSPKDEKGEHICEVCNKSFALGARLKKHINQVHLCVNSMPPCPICEKVMKNEHSMQRHLRGHVGPFNCSYCSAKFKSRDEFLDHQATAHPRRSYACRICSKQFTSKLHLWNHMRRAHVEPGEPVLKDHKEYVCQDCGKHYARPDKLRNHIAAAHTGIREHKCDMCDSAFVLSWKLKEHVKNVHNKNNPCNDCEQSFSTGKKLEIHNSLWHSGPYPCNICSESFSHKKELLDHEFDAHGLNGIECPVCNMNFRNKRKLDMHQDEVHNASTQLCDLCGECFPNKTELKPHLTDEHFEGDQTKMLILYPNLAEDQVEQSSGPGSTCEFCDKTFWFKVPYKAHLKSEHFDGDETSLIESYPSLLKVPDPPEPAICDYCGKTFGKRSSLNLHLRVHGVIVNKKKLKEELIPSSDEEPDLSNIEPRNKKSEYSCDICGREFSRHASLKKHVAIHLEMNETDVAMKEVELEEHERAEEEEQMERDGSLIIKGAVKEYMCLECKQVFKRRSDLDNHMLEHKTGIKKEKTQHKTGIKKEKKAASDKARKFTSNVDCEICGKSFSANINLRRHTMLQHGVKLERPDKSAQFVDQETAKEIKAAEDRELTCIICEKMFSARHGLRRHMRNVHKDSKSKKQFLGTNFSLQAKGVAKTSGRETIKAKKMNKKLDDGKNEVDASDDTKILDKGKLVFPCNVCGNIYASSWGLMQHIHDKHPGSEEDVNVPQIDEIFGKDEKGEVSGTPEMMRKAKSSKPPGTSAKMQSKASKSPSNEVKLETSPDQKYGCPYCSNYYASAKGRIKHIQVMHPGKKIKYGSSTTPSQPLKTLPAPMPKQTTVSTSGRIITKKVYEDVALQCHICEKFFTEDMYLKRHMNIKHGIKNEPASKKRIFTDENTEFDTYSCNKCSKSFEALLNLSRHMIMKHKVKISYEALLAQKESKRNAEKPIDQKNDICCTICEKKFKTLNSLAQHLSMKHKNDDQSDGPPSKKTKLTSQSPLKQEVQDVVYKCQKCSNLYSNVVNLSRHMIMKHKIKIGIDALLKQAEPRSESDGHSEQKNDHRCNICEKNFRNMKSLEQHISMKHKNDLQTDGPPRKKTKLIHEADRLSDRSKKQTQSKSESKDDGHSEKELDQKKSIQCTICAKTFRNTGLLKQHISMQHKKGDPLDKPETKTKPLPHSQIDKADKDKNMNKYSSGKQPTRHKEPIKKQLSHTCKECQKSFHGWKALKCHMQMKHKLPCIKDEDEFDGMKTRNAKKTIEIKQEVLECDVCQNKFISQKTLDIHMRKHTGETPFACSLCDKKFISKFKLECHYKSSHAKKYKKMLKCKTCLRLFKSEAALMKHKITHKKDETFECRFCKTKFTDKVKHAEHEKVHTDRPFKCEKCDKSFRWPRNLASHIGLFHNATETLMCSVCNKVFSKQENLDKHMVIHKVKKYLCKKCGKKFGKEKMLQTHIDIAHNVKSATVKLASKSGNVKQMKSQSPDKNLERKEIICNVCNKSFNSQEMLLEHMESHSSKEFKCSCCPLSYKHKRSLVTHEKKLNHQEKINEKEMINLNNKLEKGVKDKTAKTDCPKCGKTFGARVNVLRHILTAHKENKSSTVVAKKNNNYCNKCKFAFSKRLSYTRHMKTVHGHDLKFKKRTGIIKTSEMPEVAKVCPVCNMTFRSHRNLEKHVLNVHKCKLGGLPTVDEIKESGYPQDFSCYYCSDCTKVHWSQTSYMTHLKEMHPDRVASELAKQAQSPIPMSSIRKEMFDTESMSPKHQHLTKRSPNVGPVRHKCELCGRVHWTEKSFEAHMLKYHPDKEAKNPVDNSDSSNIDAYPSVEMVNDGDHDHFDFESIDHDAPANYKQLSGAPVVRLKRISQAADEDETDADEAGHIVDVNEKPNTEVTTHGDLQEDVKDSINEETMDIGDSDNIAGSKMGKIPEELSNSDTLGVLEDAENLAGAQTDDSKLKEPSVDRDLTVNDKETLGENEGTLPTSEIKTDIGNTVCQATDQNSEHPDNNKEMGETIESHSEEIVIESEDVMAMSIEVPSTEVQDEHVEPISHATVGTGEINIVTETCVSDVNKVDELGLPKDDNVLRTEFESVEKDILPVQSIDCFESIVKDPTDEVDVGIAEDTNITCKETEKEDADLDSRTHTCNVSNEAQELNADITETVVPVNEKLSISEAEQKHMAELSVAEPDMIQDANASQHVYENVDESESPKDSTETLDAGISGDMNITEKVIEYENVCDVQSVDSQEIETETENLGQLTQIQEVNEFMLQSDEEKNSELHHREEIFVDGGGVSEPLEDFVEAANLGTDEDANISNGEAVQNTIIPGGSHDLNNIDSNDYTEIEKYSQLEGTSSEMLNVLDQKDSSEFVEEIETEIPMHSSDLNPEADITVEIMQQVDQNTNSHAGVDFGDSEMNHLL